MRQHAEADKDLDPHYAQMLKVSHVVLAVEFKLIRYEVPRYS